MFHWFTWLHFLCKCYLVPCSHVHNCERKRVGHANKHALKDINLPKPLRHNIDVF